MQYWISVRIKGEWRAARTSPAGAAWEGPLKEALDLASSLNRHGISAIVKPDGWSLANA